MVMRMRRKSAGFRQMSLRALPERPRLPHSYFDAEPVDIEMDSVPFGRIRVHYRTAGSGPPLLLVHGLMTTGYSWRYVLADLAVAFRVIVVDLPGCGRTDGPVGRRYGSAELATWIGEFQRAAGIDGCAVVGNSLGGCLVLRRALDAPSSFSRVAIIHSPVLPEAKHRALHLVLALPGVASGLAAYVRRSPMRWTHSRTHYYDETLKSWEEVRAYSESLAHIDGARVFMHYLRDGLRPAALADTVQRLRRRRAAGLGFPVPLLAVYSKENDPMVPPRMGRALAELVPSARVVWLERASHFVHVDQPEAVSSLLLDFLTTP
ncbi:alpha/beta fold hydrolase [Spirillospora sp. CA-108201]